MTIDTDILARLRLCVLDITGINTATLYENVQGPASGVLPFIEHRIGPQQIVGTSRGKWRTQGIFMATAYLKAFPSNDVTDVGNQALADAAPFVTRIRRFFLENQRLATSTLDDMAELILPVQYQMTSPLGLLANDEIVGFTYQLTITFEEWLT